MKYRYYNCHNEPEVQITFTQTDGELLGMPG